MDETVSKKNQLDQYSDDDTLALIKSVQMTLMNDLRRLDRNIEIQALKNQELMQRVEELEQQAKENKDALAINAIQNIDFSESIKDLENASFDGEFTWRISDFTEKLQNGKSGHHTSIYSSPFYTAKDA